MTQTLETTAPLTDDERRMVQAYAESLIARRHAAASPAPSARINVDALYGMCAGMGGDKPDKELIREAWDDLLKKYDDK